MIEHETKEYWREKVGISFGMSKEHAMEKFREWRETKRACLRCEGDLLVSYCPLQHICREADTEGQDVGDAPGNDNRRRADQVTEPKTTRVEISKSRKRTPIR